VEAASKAANNQTVGNYNDNLQMAYKYWYIKKGTTNEGYYVKYNNQQAY
jgi:hypothetical protein